MSITNVILAVEDELSESISTQILRYFDIEIRWDLERAASASPSLKRTLDRISQIRGTGANQ